MKVHQYNEMMKWLTRPAPDPSLKQQVAKQIPQFGIQGTYSAPEQIDMPNIQDLIREEGIQVGPQVKEGGRIYDTRKYFKPGGLVEPGVTHYATKVKGFEKGNVWYKQNIGKYKTDIVRLRKLRHLLDTAEKGSTLNINELYQKSGVSRRTIDNILMKEYKGKFDIPGMGKAQSLNIQKLNLQKFAQPVDIPTPFPKSDLVKWPNEGIKNKYIADLKTKYTLPKGSSLPESAKVSNAALAKKYFGKVNQATIAKVERINNILSRDLNLTYPKAKMSSSLRRYGRVIESQKYLSAAEKEILKKQTTQKKVLNKYFKNNPEKLFTNKKLKELIDVKLKNGKLDFTPRYDNPKKYAELAKHGKLFDEFDISPIRGEKRNIQYPVNKNIGPSKFNQGFIRSVDAYFKNTAGSTNPEVIANKKAIHEFLKSKGYTVEIMGEGRIGAKVLPAIHSATGRLPNIENTLKQLDLPQLVPTSKIISKQKISAKPLKELIEKIGCSGLAAGGRVSFQDGSTCYSRGIEKIKVGNIQTPAEKSNFSKLTKITGGLKKLGALLFGPVEMGALPLFLAAEGAYGRYASERDFRSALERQGIEPKAINNLAEVYGRELADLGNVGLESYALDQGEIPQTREFLKAEGVSPLEYQQYAGEQVKEERRTQAEEEAELYKKLYPKAQKEKYDPYAPMMAEGGRVPFVKGTLVDKGRRAFMKWLAGMTGAAVATGTGLLKWGKLTGKGTTAIKAGDHIIQGTSGMPDWFIPLVNRVTKEGTDVSKKLGTVDREIVHTKSISKTEDVTVYQNMDTGNVRVEYGSPEFNKAGKVIRASNDPDVVHLEYRAPEVIESGKYKGKKTKSEFSAVESEPEVVNWDGDIEKSGINEVGNVDELVTDTSKLKQFATKKKLTHKDKVVAKKKQKYKTKLESDTMEQIDYIEKKHGPLPDPSDYSSADTLDEAVAKYRGEKASGGSVDYDTYLPDIDDLD